MPFSRASANPSCADRSSQVVPRPGRPPTDLRVYCGHDRIAGKVPVALPYGLADSENHSDPERLITNRSSPCGVRPAPRLTKPPSSAIPAKWLQLLLCSFGPDL